MLALAASFGGLSYRAEAQPPPALRQEAFDRDPSWEGVNNLVKVEKPVAVIQEFGYSRTQHAGGQAAGEIGGRVQRSSTSAFYGMRLEKPKTLDSKLRCTGSFAVTESTGTSSLCFGWFNTKTPEARPLNWMGMALSGERTGCEVHVGYRTGGGFADGPGRVTGKGPNYRPGYRDLNMIPKDGTRYTFDFLYDPEASGGTGEITFTLGGKGPFTGGPFTFKLPAAHRQSGATFDAFGIINSLRAGNWITVWFDDLVIDGKPESFDRDPPWLGQNNRARFDDYGVEGAHQFGFSDTAHAGGKRGELGGLIFSSAAAPGYYGDKVGRLTLDHRLTASGKIALKEYGADGGLYFGWFDSARRGQTPVNVLGIFIDGTTSSGPRFKATVASADPAQALRQDYKTAPMIAPDGTVHTWKIEYQPGAHGESDRLTVWLDDRPESFTLAPELRKAGATFDRFGLFVDERGGRASRVYLDDLTYTAGQP